MIKTDKQINEFKDTILKTIDKTIDKCIYKFKMENFKKPTTPEWRKFDIVTRNITNPYDEIAKLMLRIEELENGKEL